MALSEKFINEKMLEVERERLAVERESLNLEIHKTKVLGMMGLEIETNAKAEKYNKADQERLADDLADIKKRIEKRWSE